MSTPLTPENWFEYHIRVHPNHTDYAGYVWHGSYIVWMEEARVEYLRSLGLDYARLVALGCELPVVELSIRYHRALSMGMSAVVRTRMVQTKGVRLNWDYQIQSPEGDRLYLTAKVTLVAVDRAQGKILRQLPPILQEVLSVVGSVEC
ncbi:MAG: acyl-CoA thioesterase [Cyanosarcina radialis HA8281-LM2]|jgi:acyl-CoA thioester hydrolase|nr:acyl-CoA thioesterase [Cyanosarcina radialis HA8281-LM2]